MWNCSHHEILIFFFKLIFLLHTLPAFVPRLPASPVPPPRQSRKSRRSTQRQRPGDPPQTFLARTDFSTHPSQATAPHLLKLQSENPKPKQYLGESWASPNLPRRDLHCGKILRPTVYTLEFEKQQFRLLFTKCV